MNDEEKQKEIERIFEKLKWGKETPVEEKVNCITRANAHTFLTLYGLSLVGKRNMTISEFAEFNNEDYTNSNNHLNSLTRTKTFVKRKNQKKYRRLFIEPPESFDKKMLAEAEARDEE